MIEEIFEVKTSPYGQIPEHVKSAFNLIQSRIKPVKSATKTQGYWASLIRDQFRSYFIGLQNERFVDGLTGEKIESKKVLATDYKNSKDEDITILGYDVKNPHTYHIMLKYKP